MKSVFTSTGSKHVPDIHRQQLEEIVRLFQSPLLRYAGRLLNNATLAQDVVQNVFTKLIGRSQPRMETVETLRPWLFRVTHNEAVDLIRKEERRKALHERCFSDAAVGQGECDVSVPFEGESRSEIVMSCLNVLSVDEREVVILRLQQGMSYEEIASATCHPRGTVGALLHTAIRKLSAELRRKEKVV